MQVLYLVLINADPFHREHYICYQSYKDALPLEAKKSFEYERKGILKPFQIILFHTSLRHITYLSTTIFYVVGRTET